MIANSVRNRRQRRPKPKPVTAIVIMAARWSWYAQLSREPPGWRFTSGKGMALTAVSVADVAREVRFPNTSGAWIDGVSGEEFAAKENTLAVPVPAHRVRLLSAGTS